MKVPKYFYFRVKTVNHGTALDLEDASDVDVVEVVRCKDCKCYQLNHRYCSFHRSEFCVDDFCSYAERREVTE